MPNDNITPLSLVEEPQKAVAQDWLIIEKDGTQHEVSGFISIYPVLSILDEAHNPIFLLPLDELKSCRAVSA